MNGKDLEIMRVPKKLISDIKKAVRLSTGVKYSLFHIEIRNGKFDALSWGKEDPEEAIKETIMLEYIEQNDILQTRRFALRLHFATRDHIRFQGMNSCPTMFVLVDDRAVQRVAKDIEGVKGT